MAFRASNMPWISTLTMAARPGFRWWCPAPKRAAKSRRRSAFSRAKQAQEQRLLVDVDARDFERFGLAAERLKTQRRIKLARGYLYCRHVERDPFEARLRAGSFDQRHHQPTAGAVPAPSLGDTHAPDKSLVLGFLAALADEAGHPGKRTVAECAHHEVRAGAQTHADIFDAGGLELGYGRAKRIRFALERFEPQRAPCFGIVLGQHANLHRRVRRRVSETRGCSESPAPASREPPSASHRARAESSEVSRTGPGLPDSRAAAPCLSRPR